MNDLRKGRCECGSALFYIEPDVEGKLWVFCSAPNCNRKWEKKRREDDKLPTKVMLQDMFNQ